MNKRNRGLAGTTGKWSAYLIVALGMLVMLAPFYFMFVFASHTRSEIFQLPPPVWFGDAFPSNVQLLLSKVPTFWGNFGMSLYVALMSTALTLLFCSMGGYAFAIYEFRYKNQLFALVMSTMLLPPFLGMIPTYMIMDTLGWINQPRALYIPGAAGAFGIFYRCFLTIPGAAATLKITTPAVAKYGNFRSGLCLHNIE